LISVNRTIHAAVGPYRGCRRDFLSGKSAEARHTWNFTGAAVISVFPSASTISMRNQCSPRSRFSRWNRACIRSGASTVPSSPTRIRRFRATSSAGDNSISTGTVPLLSNIVASLAGESTRFDFDQRCRRFALQACKRGVHIRLPGTWSRRCSNLGVGWSRA
jgi:hypothetical protein